MKIQLSNVGKRYGFKWILRNVNLHLKPGQKYAVIGPNGSGKSTLLKIISGFLTPSEGKMQFSIDEKKVPINDVYKNIAFAAPYVDLVESFTLQEAIKFHFKFKTPLNNLKAKDILSLLNLDTNEGQFISSFSSGMQQRLKLTLALCSNTSIIMLDEPTSNLDHQGIEWYNHLIKEFGKNRTMVIASNVTEDYHFCNEVYNVKEWKVEKK